MTEEILDNVNPTRMELLEIRKKRVLAEKGHKLLEEKRDALVERFFTVIEQRNALRQELNDLFSQGYTSLIQAEMILGEHRVDELATLTPPLGEIQMSAENIMGVKIPKVDTTQITYPKQPSYGFFESCSKFDDAYQQFQKIVQQLLLLSDIESDLKALILEIEKTKRRVNVLENTLIPKLDATIKYISMQLDEREREDFFRRKRIKAIMEKQKTYEHRR